MLKKIEIYFFGLLVDYSASGTKFELQFLDIQIEKTKHLSNVVYYNIVNLCLRNIRYF